MPCSNCLLYLLTTKPHDEHHFGCDLVVSKKVQQEWQREDVDRSAQENQDLPRQQRLKHGNNLRHINQMHFFQCKSTYYAPDDKGYFKFMREAEDGETKEGKHTCLCRERLKNTLKTYCKIKTDRSVRIRNNSLTTHEGHGTQCLLHEDLGDRRQVVMGVVRHHNTRKQDRHNTCRKREGVIF